MILVLAKSNGVVMPEEIAPAMEPQVAP